MNWGNLLWILCAAAHTAAAIFSTFLEIDLVGIQRSGLWAWAVLGVCLILLVAGCFIDAVPALLIFAPIFVPTAQAYNINLVYFGVIMVVTLCIGLATPPVGINLYVASSVGGQPVHKIIPHLPIPLLTIAIGTVMLIMIPAITTFLPMMAK